MVPDGVQDSETALAKHGFLVRIQNFSDEYSVEDLVAVEKQSVGDARFAMPPGFQKQAMP